MSSEEQTSGVDSPTPSAPRSPPKRRRGVFQRSMSLLGYLLATVATLSIAAGVAIVGPNIEEWRDVLPTLSGAGYADSTDLQAANALGWAQGQEQSPRRSKNAAGGSGRAYRFLAPARGAAPSPGHWCSSNPIGYRVDLTGARLAGLEPNRELRRWQDAFAHWERASEGKYQFEFRGETRFPLVMDSSLEDMKIGTRSLKADEIAITYATSRTMGDPRWSDYLHAGLGPSLGIGGIGPVRWGPAVAGSGLITSGTIILDAHDVADLDGPLPTVYVHESGHALGLGHVKNQNQIMYENASATAQINDGDRRGIQKLASAECR